jgi:hypothetical protein
LIVLWCLGREAQRGDGVKTARERAEAKRSEKLQLVREQVQNGSLVIRQMTDEERRRYPPRPTEPKRPGRR